MKIHFDVITKRVTGYTIVGEAPAGSLDLSDGVDFNFLNPMDEYEVQNGSVVHVGASTERLTELLTDAKVTKKLELEKAFTTNSKLPVTVGIKTYNGGKDSAQALRDYIQLVQESGGTEYQIWGTDNIIGIYTLTEATAIKLAVGTAVAQEEFILRNKKNLVDAARTVAEVEVIV